MQGLFCQEWQSSTRATEDIQYNWFHKLTFMLSAPFKDTKPNIFFLHVCNVFCKICFFLKRLYGMGGNDFHPNFYCIHLNWCRYIAILHLFWLSIQLSSVVNDQKWRICSIVAVWSLCEKSFLFFSLYSSKSIPQLGLLLRMRWTLACRCLGHCLISFLGTGVHEP